MTRINIWTGEISALFHVFSKSDSRYKTSSGVADRRLPSGDSSARLLAKMAIFFNLWVQTDG